MPFLTFLDNCTDRRIIMYTPSAVIPTTSVNFSVTDSAAKTSQILIQHVQDSSWQKLIMKEGK